MRIRSARGVPPRRLRRTVTALATAVGIGITVMAVPTAAYAAPPPSTGTWCYEDWYVVQSVGGVAHDPAIAPRSFHNSSSSTTVTWSESYTTTKLYGSGYSTDTYFPTGVNQDAITRGVNNAQPRTTYSTIMVNGTSSFSAPLPPQTTGYATYGPYRLETSGVYYHRQYTCEDGSYYSLTKGPLTAYSLTGVGWHYWDSNGSSSDL